jgi:signal transduction histidine kinase
LILERARHALKFFGPYQYNPTLIFAFFYAVFFSRFIPLIQQESPGPERWKLAIAAFILAALPSFFFAAAAYLFQRYRVWSNKSLLLYILEVSVAQSTLFITSPVLHYVMGERADGQFQTLGILSPSLFLSALFFALVGLALLHRAERNIISRLVEADELVLRLESDREELVKSDEELRQQTSQFLHDRVQSDLMVVAMKLKSIQGQSTPEVDAAITKAIARLENTRMFDLRNLVQVLTPNFESGDIKDVLLLLSDQYSSSLKVTFKIDDEVELLDENQRLGVFRIAEQALLNALVHGPAENVHISIAISGGKSVQLSITDDGPGADLSSSKPGVGTAIIDSWVSILKGSRKIHSQPGSGYNLKVNFELQ